jgi:hypothetical protein
MPIHNKPLFKHRIFKNHSRAPTEYTLQKLSSKLTMLCYDKAPPSTLRSGQSAVRTTGSVASGWENWPRTITSSACNKRWFLMTHSLQGEITVTSLWSNCTWPIYWRGLHWSWCLHNLMALTSRYNNCNRCTRMKCVTAIESIWTWRDHVQTGGKCFSRNNGTHILTSTVQLVASNNYCQYTEQYSCSSWVSNDSLFDILSHNSFCP